MTERPAPLGQLDRYFAAATIAHEYLADLQRELALLGQDSERTRRLLGESASVVTERMPALTRELHELGREWDVQCLLDPPKAKLLLARAELRLAALEPELSALRSRQDNIVAEMREIVARARRR